MRLVREPFDKPPEMRQLSRSDCSDSVLRILLTRFSSVKLVKMLLSDGRHAAISARPDSSMLHHMVNVIASVENVSLQAQKHSSE